MFSSILDCLKIKNKTLHKPIGLYSPAHEGTTVGFHVPWRAVPSQVSAPADVKPKPLLQVTSQVVLKSGEGLPLHNEVPLTGFDMWWHSIAASLQ